MLSVWPTRRVGGYEGHKTFVYLKWASHFWLSVQMFNFPQKEFFFWLWVSGWFGLGDGSTRTPPPPRRQAHPRLGRCFGPVGLRSHMQETEQYWKGGTCRSEMWQES